MKREPSYGYGINENTGRGCGENVEQETTQPKLNLAVEYFHGLLEDNYHKWRGIKKSGLSLTFVDGREFAEFIAQAKMATYRKFTKYDPLNKIRKTLAKKMTTK